jgi:hypothetical protein
MRFFGDHARDEDPRAVADDVARELRRAACLPRGIIRHAAVAAALVRAGELAQALGDAAGAGACAAAAAGEALAETARIARGLWRSFEAAGRAHPPAPRALALRGAPPTVRVRRPEGYALYAVYPEAFAVAGRALRGARAAWIGIRSIGPGLAAMAAAGAGSRGPVLSVRPGGSPFSRVLAPEALREALARGRGGAFAVVDEGPGLSGSTLAAVAEALLEAGVSEERIHLFTSHARPPGPEAPPRVRELFGRLARHCAPPDPGLLAPAVLAGDLVGPVRSVCELGDGAWRRFTALPEDAWPASTGWMERRKVLLEDARGGRWLARFAGLGEQGERKLARARALYEAGLRLEPAGLRHGFLVEPWCAPARPLPTAGVRPSRLLDALVRLLAVGAGRPAGEGASPAELAAMARANAAEALGPAAAAAAAQLEAFVPRLAVEARPAEVDARLAPWKWLVGADRRLVKCDGLDHHAGHELSGCQDLLWDVAGAEAEHGLAPREAVRLAEAARTLAPGADPACLPFYRVCYLALELGRWSFAAAAAEAGPERRRREAVRERYRRGLAGALERLAPGARRVPGGAPPDGRGRHPTKVWRGRVTGERRAPAEGRRSSFSAGE